MTVKSAARVLDILELLAGHPQGLRNTEVSSKLGFPASSTHALLKTLTKRCYLVHDPTRRVYRLGARMFEVGSQYLEQVSVVELARETMRQMRSLCDETISLGVLGRDKIVLVSKNESSRALRIGNPLGTRLPIHSSAMGKATLASWPHEDVVRFLSESELPANTLNTQTDIPRLLEEINRVRSTGIAYDLEESTEGINAIATVIDDGRERAAVSLAIVVPSVRGKGKGKDWDRLPDLLLTGARLISSQVRGRSDDPGKLDFATLEQVWTKARVAAD